MRLRGQAAGCQPLRGPDASKESGRQAAPYAMTGSDPVSRPDDQIPRAAAVRRACGGLCHLDRACQGREPRPPGRAGASPSRPGRRSISPPARGTRRRRSPRMSPASSPATSPRRCCWRRPSSPPPRASPTWRRRGRTPRRCPSRTRASISSPAASPPHHFPDVPTFVAEVWRVLKAGRHVRPGRQHLARCGIDARVLQRRTARRGADLQRLREDPRPEPRPLPRHGRVDEVLSRYRLRGAAQGAPAQGHGVPALGRAPGLRPGHDRAAALHADRRLAGAAGVPQAARRTTASSGSPSTRPS